MDFSKVDNVDLYGMCLRGDEEAWAYLYNYILCVARSKHWRLKDQPEDVAQAVVCNLLTKGIDMVQNAKAFRGFVRTATRNYMIDLLKKKSPVTRSLNGCCDNDSIPPFDPPSNRPGPEEILAWSTLQEAFDRAVAGLPEQCREVMNNYIDYKIGLFDTLTSLAKALGVSVGTLSSRVTRCVNRLRGDQEIRLWLEG